MMLFDDTERYDASPSAYSEDTFSFYNRVAGPTWTRIRRTLDGWFADYPVEHSADLRGRFRSNREGAHASAFWEMYLHHLFGRLGYEVTVHPTVPDTTRQPDFEITRGDERLYVEAAVVFSGIVDEEADPVRDGWIMDTINKATSENFLVGVTFEQRGKLRPRDRDIVEPLEKWLGELDPDAILNATDDDLPVKRITTGDWHLLFEAVPVVPEARGTHPAGRLLGYGPGSVGWVDDKPQLRQTLKKKRGRYGNLDIPFVVALNCRSSFVKPEDIERALFGSLAFRYTPGVPGSGRPIREKDGTWMGKHGRTGRRMSAVLTAVELHPGSMGSVSPWLWCNPWAHDPLSVDWPFSRGTVDEAGQAQLDEREVDMPGLLGIRNDWPGPEPRFPGET
jgi:hypothetical protein